ncbi:hypothetical protein NL676_028968 [Syzygium grande]|nr:hypothetical protein NL676_028968 [Syzygium grande]
MRAPQDIPPIANENPAPLSPGPLPLPHSDQFNLIIFHCIAFLPSTILTVLMVIFLAIPALMTPEFRINPTSSLSSLNISTSHVTAQWNIALSVKNPSQLIAVKYTHMKLFLSFQGQLRLSHPYLVPHFTQGPGNVTTVPAKVLSTLLIINDWHVKGLVSSLKGSEVSIDVVVKAKRSLHLGPWVPVLDVYVSCMGVTFTALTDSEDGGNWMVLGGTLSCMPDIITQL